MKVRKAYLSDKESIKDIWKYCFAGESEEYYDYYFDNKFKAENTIVVSDGENAVASIQINQYKLNLNNKEEDISYVVGVSTMPEVRGKGVMKEMMGFLLNDMYERGQNVSILMPVDFRLYRKYGYENCYDILEHRIQVDELSGFKINADFRRAKDSDIEKLNEIYVYSNKGLNGYVKRDRDRLENMFREAKTDGSNIYIAENEDGERMGYMYYSISGGVFYVREIYFKSVNTLKSILAFIYNHNTQCKDVVIMEDIRNRIGSIIKNPKHTECVLKPFMMGRVINVKGALEGLNTDGLKNNISISVDDEYIVENKANYKLSKSNGKLSVDKEEYDVEKSDVSLNINQFTQLVFSYKDIKDISEIYDIEIKKDKMEVLEDIFRVRKNHINEYE